MSNKRRSAIWLTAPRFWSKLIDLDLWHQTLLVWTRWGLGTRLTCALRCGCVKIKFHALIGARMSEPHTSIPYSGKIWRALNLAKKGCILILAKFKFGDLELYLWRNHFYAVTYRSAFSAWRTLACRNWEWKLWKVDRRQLYSRLPCFWKYLEPNHRVRIELRARKDQHWGSLRRGCGT